MFEVPGLGLVRVVDKMGDDAAIVQAARVSYGAGTKTVREDEKLIRYLMRNAHTSPFEMCEIKLHIKCPIFVARQWVRHRTASINEVSARYSEVKEDFHWPREWRAQSSSNKQGSEGTVQPGGEYGWSVTAARCFENYQHAIDSGVAREQARIMLPLSTMTEFYWKIDLHNLLHFLRLRVDPHAQLEIRRLAEIILHQIVAEWVPMTYRAFLDYRLNAVTLSAQQIAVLRGAQDVELSREEQQVLKEVFGK